MAMALDRCVVEDEGKVRMVVVGGGGVQVRAGRAGGVRASIAWQALKAMHRRTETEGAEMGGRAQGTIG